MPTMTMQSIADVAHVRRAVVSTWRARYAGTAHPFPPSLSDAELVFDADSVAAWLEETGRGNNPEAPLEAALHSSRWDDLLDDPTGASALCLLHELAGGPLETLSADSARAVIESANSEHLLPTDEAGDLLDYEDLVAGVDQLAEAGFSARAVLDRLVAAQADQNGPWADDALTASGVAVIVKTVRELLRLAPRRLDPCGPGGLLLATELARALGDDEQPVYGIRRLRGAPAASLVAIRMLAAHAGPERIVLRAERPEEPHLALLLCQSPETPSELFDLIESALLELGPSDVAVVVAPSALLLEPLRDTGVRAGRSRLLLPHPDSPAPLRYAARLPKGLSRFGGRRRLALWAFGAAVPYADSDWTIYGEHAGTSMDALSREALAADVAAALTGGAALATHAFLSSGRVATDIFLHRQDLTIAPGGLPARSGGESLARLWELDEGLLDELVSMRATDTPCSDAEVSWAECLGGLAREIRGARLPKEALERLGPGRVTVIGPEEVRAPETLGARAIDRLVLEKAAPRSTLTAPGDVVFVAEGGPAALVDAIGGRVVQSPARILRCRSELTASRVLHPHAVAADIARQRGRDRSTWRLRTVPVHAIPALDLVARHLAEHREALRRRLAELDRLEDELTQAVTAGTLAVAPKTPMKEK